ncbi:F0F1 ATP synthase subunit B [Alteromonadaceae bacterium BrNp21-10]|nr:F0F1 ATP synthase subunit B [Alteromonadaceae bacterium BrNp21-10]
MLIDWFTVSAQIINFLLLVWLLKRFLYRPIQNAIDAREQQTAKIVADAAALKTQADQQLQTYVKNNQQFAEQRTSLLNEATEQANVERDKLIKDARQTTEQLRDSRMQSLEQELTAIQQDIVKQNMDEVYAVSHQVLSDLADEDLQQQMFKRFIQRLQSAFTGDSRQLDAIKLKPGSAPVVRSTFTLSNEQQQQIEQLLAQQLLSPLASATTQTAGKSVNEKSNSLHLDYQLVDELLCGIEININGWKLAWSGNNYLHTLQQSALKLSAQSSAFSATAVKENEKDKKLIHEQNSTVDGETH